MEFSQVFTPTIPFLYIYSYALKKEIKLKKYGTYSVYVNTKTGKKKVIKVDEKKPGKNWVRDEGEEEKVASLIREGN